MELKSVNTEEIILEAAKELFMEKGYTGARMTEIAELAGVNHALLHYYFRTKENLFNRIFEQKAQQLLEFFIEAFNRDCSFFEKLRMGIEMHFDFLSQNPELPLFVLREVIQDKKRKEFMIAKAFPIGKNVIKKISEEIEKEVNEGSIRQIKPWDLLLNIASLNVFTFIIAQVFFDIKKDRKKKAFVQFLKERKENNVRVIIDSLKT